MIRKLASGLFNLPLKNYTDNTGFSIINLVHTVGKHLMIFFICFKQSTAYKEIAGRIMDKLPPHSDPSPVKERAR